MMRLKKSPVQIIAGTAFLFCTILAAYTAYQSGVQANLLPLFNSDVWLSYLPFLIPVISYVLITISLFTGIPWLTALGGLLAAAQNGFVLYTVIFPHFQIVDASWLFLARYALLLLSFLLLFLCGILPGWAKSMAIISALCTVVSFVIATYQAWPAKTFLIPAIQTALFAAGVILLGFCFQRLYLKKRAAKAGWSV